MDFTFYMPTKVFFGRDCVLKNGGALQRLGKHALIVTGQSAKKNGALADVKRALEQNGQSFTLFDRVTPNPTVACVREGISALKRENADFLVAVGGGSVMDAAKAIALLAVQERSDGEIFAGGFEENAYPTAHVPTTAGTGSEVTQYSILTNDFKQTKTSISSPCLFPKTAFLDGKYMKDLSRSVTVNTALDALSHATEGMLSRAATPLSDALAKECLRRLFPLLKELNGDLTLSQRDELLYASCLAGMTIAHSGTTAVHGMGYSLTYHYGIDHGRANALLLGETMRLCDEKNISAAREIYAACGIEGAEEFCVALNVLIGERERIPYERLCEFAVRAMENKNIKKSVYEPTESEVKRIFLHSFGYSDD